MYNIAHTHRWTSVCSCIESILKIRDPLKRLYEEDLIDRGFHGKIPTDEMFDSMSVLAGPLKIIKALFMPYVHFIPKFTMVTVIVS